MSRIRGQCLMVMSGSLLTAAEELFALVARFLAACSRAPARAAWFAPPSRVATAVNLVAASLLVTSYARTSMVTFALGALCPRRLGSLRICLMKSATIPTHFCREHEVSTACSAVTGFVKLVCRGRVCGCVCCETRFSCITSRGRPKHFLNTSLRLIGSFCLEPT